jgi:tetratricopeptide (TPR) repeat protein
MGVFGEAVGTAEALALLLKAREARSDPATAERAVEQALAVAPDDFEARLGAYRFYFYNHRYADALPHAAFLVSLIARRLNIAGDWRAVRPGDAAFDALEEAPGIYLQALMAWGYCKARLGALDEGAEAIAKVAELNPRDRFGARRLLAVVVEPEQSEEE